MMTRINSIRVIFFSIAVIFLYSACRKRGDVSLPDNYVEFSTTEQGIGENENSLTVKLLLTRHTDRDVPVKINLETAGVAYGTDFTTTPAATGNVIDMVIPSGNNEFSIKIEKAAGALFDGDEKVSLEINRSENPLLIGEDKKFTLEFKELVASNSTLRIDGGGASYPNKVFIDLSANRQTAVLRTNWDLGFYTGEPGIFRVTLNSSVGMMAKQLAKNSLAQVTAADTLGFWETVAYSPFAPDVSQMPYIDYPSGELTKTAIAEISATADDNKVYIINRGSGVGTPAPGRGWKKVRIVRNATGGYTLQFADIAATTFTSVDIQKDDAYFFKYVSFDTGIVPVEPQKTKWDIAWNYSGFLTNFGTGEVPYLFQDIVHQNRNVQVAKVLTSTKGFDSFNEASLTDATIPAADWKTSLTSIGSDWRRTTPSPAQTHADRYYIIKDGDGNYYKLRFTALTDAGVRGFPSIQWVLVKRK